MDGRLSKRWVLAGSNETYILWAQGKQRFCAYKYGLCSEQKGDYYMKIIHVMDHYEVYDLNDNFICSGDTLNEAVREAEKYLAERR